MADDGDEATETVVEEEPTTEATVDDDATTGASVEDATKGASVDDATAGATVDPGVESFLDLEAEAHDPQRTGENRGRAVDVERVSADAVPDDYPVEITTAEALAITLEFENRVAREEVYFEWAAGAPGERLERLLALHGLSAERFGDLYGKSIPVRREAGHPVAVVPDEPPRGSPLGIYGIAGVLGLDLLSLLLILVGLGGALSSVPLVLGLLALNVAGLPAATYLDGWHLRTHTDWDHAPSFWALLAAMPGVNVVSSLAYLYTRREAEPLA